MPNAIGTYEGYGDYNDRPYYRRTDGAYFIYVAADKLSWNLDSILGGFGPAYWTNPTSEPDGTYAPQGTATGIATVTKL